MTAAEPTPEPQPTPAPAPTPEPEPQPTSWMDEIGLPTDLKSNPSVTKFKGPADVVKSYVELEKHLGTDRVTVPSDSATEEEWAAFYEQTGRPDSPNGYGLSDWQPPADVPWIEGATAKMIDRMHAHGLSKRQAEGLLNDYAEMQKEHWYELQTHEEAARKEAVESLRKQWGAAADGKFEAAVRAAVHFAGQSGEDGNILDRLRLSSGAQLGSHPEVIELFARIGEAMGEDIGGGPAPAPRTTSTPQEALNKLAAMHADAEQMKILNDQTHPQHKALYEKMTSLQKQAYPD